MKKRAGKLMLNRETVVHLTEVEIQKAASAVCAGASAYFVCARSNMSCASECGYSEWGCHTVY